MDEKMEKAWIAAASACVEVIDGEHQYVAPVSPEQWERALNAAFDAARLREPAGVGELVQAARNAAIALHNCVSAGQIGDGYGQLADDVFTAIKALAAAPQPPTEAQGGGEVEAWRVPVVQSPFGEWLDHGVRDGLVLVMHRGTHGWKAAGQGHALLAHQLYVKNVEPLCATSHEVAVVGLSGGGWRTVWARSDDDVTHPAPPSAPVGVEEMQRRLDREESDHGRTIDQRDAAEDALGRMFQAVTGRPAEWSSVWGYEDAIEEVEEHIAALAQQPAAVDGAWRQKAAEWLEAKAVEQEANNQRWPDHAAAYKEWRDRPDVLRMLAAQVLAAQHQEPKP